MKNRPTWILYILIALMFSACAGTNPANSTPNADGEVAGFMTGLLHGFIAIFSLIGSLLKDDVTMYEVHNNGGPYNLGFVIGLVFMIKIIFDEDFKP